MLLFNNSITLDDILLLRFYLYSNKRIYLRNKTKTHLCLSDAKIQH